MLTRDRGQHSTPVRGLADFARVVADRLDSQRFYALDFGRSRIASSENGGRSFAFVSSRACPNMLRRTTTGLRPAATARGSR